MVNRLKAARVPITEKDLGKAPGDFTAAEIAELVRWINMLDPI